MQPTNDIIQPFNTMSSQAQTIVLPRVNPEFTSISEDPIRPFLRKILRYPGKVIYIILIILSLFFTILPWSNLVTTTNNQYTYDVINYFYLLRINAFIIIYFLSLILLLLIRLSMWTNFMPLRPYKKALEYMEILYLGAVVMFVLSIQTPSPQFGLIGSVVLNLCILAYSIYIKFIKK